MPLQFIRSSLVQYISPESGTAASTFSFFADIFGTVLILTFISVSSTPSAIACARFFTDPDAE